MREKAEIQTEHVHIRYPRERRVAFQEIRDEPEHEKRDQDIGAVSSQKLHELVVTRGISFYDFESVKRTERQYVEQEQHDIDAERQPEEIIEEHKQVVGPDQCVHIEIGRA